jgi:hypothetical protein
MKEESKIEKNEEEVKGATEMLKEKLGAKEQTLT